MDSNISLENVRLLSPPNAPPLTIWLAEQFERWLRETYHLDVQVEFDLPLETP